MNPTEAQRLSERVALLEKRAYALQNISRTDRRCLRLRGLLERAEIDARERVRPERDQIAAELRESQRRLHEWQQAVKDASKSEQPLSNRPVTMRLVERIERPRLEGGIDWSNTRLVLARYGLLELWWVRSGKHWGDQLCGYVSHGGALKVATLAENRGYGCEYRDLCDDGRLSRARILAHAGAINAHFGIPDVAESVNWQKTLLIEDQPNEDEPV